MKQELIKNKFITVCICVCLLSCSNSNNQQKQDDNILITCDSIVEELKDSQSSTIQDDTIKENVDEILNEKQFQVGVALEDYEISIDVTFDYGYYIGKAYDKETCRKYFTTWKGQNKLDSLIRIYWDKTFVRKVYDKETQQKYYDIFIKYEKFKKMCEQNKANSDNDLIEEQNEQNEKEIYEK